ncbi:MAG: restriction endonuclease [Lachnospiraceae bacterium]|nr:restriction endonuclease [Lachnospiraceae bacterium]
MTDGKIRELTDEQLAAYVNEFYHYFENGYAFEDFLKPYLEKLGLDEVVVTKKSGDGGIDLKAVRYGVDGSNGTDALEYYVQAKLRNPDVTNKIADVRALRGVMTSGSRGMFITTGKFSGDTKAFAERGAPTRPIVLIDGKKLVESCIDKGIGFVFDPVFSKREMDALTAAANVSGRLDDGSEDNGNGDAAVAAGVDQVLLEVNSKITANDIRARILRIPGAVLEIVGTECESLKVSFDGQPERMLRIDAGRCYLSGVTGLYRTACLIREDGTYLPCNTTWKCYENRIEIALTGRVQTSGRMKS